MLHGFLDIHERQCAVLFGDIGHLIEPPDSVSHVRGVGERFFALLRKGEYGIGQVAFAS